MTASERIREARQKRDLEVARSLRETREYCGTNGRYCSVGCQVRGDHRDWALSDPWVRVDQ